MAISKKKGPTDSARGVRGSSTPEYALLLSLVSACLTVMISTTSAHLSSPFAIVNQQLVGGPPTVVVGPGPIDFGGPVDFGPWKPGLSSSNPGSGPDFSWGDGGTSIEFVSVDGGGTISDSTGPRSIEDPDDDGDQLIPSFGDHDGADDLEGGDIPNGNPHPILNPP